jgi:cell division septation protein DedD
VAKAKSKTPSVGPKRLVVRACLLALFGGWFFLLGVLVGRGLVPLPFEPDHLETELATQLAEETALAQARLRQGAQEGLPEEPLRIQDLREPQVDTRVRARPGASLTGPDGVPLKKRGVPPKKRPLGAVQPPTAAAAAAGKTPKRDAAGGPGGDRVAAALVGMKAKFTLQVASVRQQAAADRIVKTLQKAGHPAYQTASRPGKNGVWYRVRVGAYETRKAAEAALGKFKESRYKPIIIQR